MRERRVEWRELDDVAVAEQVVGQSVSDRVITLGKLLGLTKVPVRHQELISWEPVSTVFASSQLPA